MQIKTINTIGRNGQRHPPGSILEIDQAEAERLIGLGAAEAVVEPEAAAEAEAPEPEAIEPEPEGDGQAVNLDAALVAAVGKIAASGDPALLTKGGAPTVVAVRDELAGVAVSAAQVQAAWEIVQAEGE